MRVFILVSCLVAAVIARPEAGYGYNNGLQQNQLGLPQNVHTLVPLVHQQLPVEHSFAGFAAPQISYGPPASAGPSTGEQIATPIAPVEHAPVQQLPHYHHQQQLEHQMQPQQDSYNMAYHHSSIQNEVGYPYGQAQTKVHKHIYVHVPPKDFEEENAIETHVHHQAGPKHKHYKIVFIKAPSAPAIRAPIVPPPPQNEEKTLIYVLHKKPESTQDIVIPTPAPTKPSKPEVYFIKYKTKKEEAPVYGPPPAVVMDPRHAAAPPSGQYGTPGMSVMVIENAELSAPISTIQPFAEEQQQQQLQQQQQPQFVMEAPSQLYEAPTTASFAGEESLATISVPSNQYLASETTHQAAVVIKEEEQQQKSQLPAANYGPPTRFFIKKRK